MLTIFIHQQKYLNQFSVTGVLFTGDKAHINRHPFADICAASLEHKMVTLHTFENQSVCLKITRKSENELFRMNFEGMRY